jgi:putative tryptophan/tyrosine transport system substrate-binding protein
VRRIGLAVVLALGLLIAPLAADAQQAPSRTFRVGFLSGYSAAGAAPVRHILVDGLRDLGYREGESFFMVERYADGRMERLAVLAREPIQLQVDVITTQTTPAALAAKQATLTVPIVNMTSGDAVGSGSVASLARPGGNVTGLSFLGTELAVKQMELLKQIATGAKRIALLGNPGIRPELGFFREMERAGPQLGFSVRFFEAKTSEDYENAFAAILQHQVDGLVVAPSIANHDDWRRIVTLAGHRRLPTICPFREFTEAGGLVSYGFNRRDAEAPGSAYAQRPGQTIAAGRSVTYFDARHIKPVPGAGHGASFHVTRRFRRLGRR